jgi:hypothetical protein
MTIEEKFAKIKKGLTIPIVVVEWEDAFVAEGWRYAEEVVPISEDPPLITSVGGEVLNTDDCLVLMESYGDGKFSGLFRIPKGNVKKRTVVGKLKVGG